MKNVVSQMKQIMDLIKSAQTSQIKGELCLKDLHQWSHQC